MPWFSWPGRKKKSVDFNAFLISKAKQLKEEADLLEVQRQNGIGQQTLTRHDPQDQQQLQQQQQPLQQATSFFASALSRPRPTSFSLVLTDEDLKGLEVQRKLEKLRRRGKEVQIERQEELTRLRTVLNEQRGTVREQWDEGIEWSEYLEVAIRSMEEMETDHKTKESASSGGDDDPSSSDTNNGNDDDDNVQGDAAGRANTSVVVTDTAMRGSREADLMKACHRADMQDRLRKLLQEQTGDEIMRVYQMGSTLKEEFGETEAKIVSQMVRRAVVLEEQKSYNEKRVDLYQQIKARYEQAAKDHMNRVYRALREKGDEGEEMEDYKANGGIDGAPKKRHSMMAKSYSSRVLAVGAEEREEQRIRRESSIRLNAAALSEVDGAGRHLKGGTNISNNGVADSTTENQDMESNNDYGMETDKVHPSNTTKSLARHAVENETMEAQTSPEIGTKARSGAEHSSRASAASRPSATHTLRGAASSDRMSARLSGSSNVRKTLMTPHVTQGDIGVTAVRSTSRVAAIASLNERRLTGETQARPVGSAGRPTMTTASRLTRPGAPTTSPRLAASSIAARRAVSTGVAE